MIRFKALLIAAITSTQLLFSGVFSYGHNVIESQKSVSNTDFTKVTTFNWKSIDNNNRIIKELARLRIIKRIEQPRTIKIINPVDKSSPIQNNTPQMDKSDKPVNDTYYNYEWYIGTTMADKAWSLVKQQREIKVAVLDTGIDYNHPDLKNRILKDLGYNFLNGTQNAADDNGHGTHVSGIIAAQANNSVGISGIVGTLDVKIIPIKVLNSKGEGQSDIIAKGIRLAADEGADIINMSFGTPEGDTYIDDAVQYANSKGVFMVAAAGNDSSDCDSYTPAGDKGVFTVSAVSSNLKRAYFSNFGTAVQVAAPGVSILSTIPGGKYQSWNGTSMAAPIVSGVAAILKAEDPSLTPDNIAAMLDNTAQNSAGQVKNSYTGYGIVNAYNAVKKLEGIK